MIYRAEKIFRYVGEHFEVFVQTKKLNHSIRDFSFPFYCNYVERW